MNKVKSFVKEFVALVSGDDAEVQAQKALRGANSALKTQIAIKDGELISKEDAVESAKERLRTARLNNGKPVTDRDQYVRELINSKNALTEAEEELQAHKELVEFLNEQLSSLDNEE